MKLALIIQMEKQIEYKIQKNLWKNMGMKENKWMTILKLALVSMKILLNYMKISKIVI
jgi:hypothetical protein